MSKLTSITIAINEEPCLARALRSAQELADEIVVVDGGSTDRTVETAHRFTDKVFMNPWPGFGAQKNFALDRATGDWVLFVDADEEVTSGLAQEIRHALAASTSSQPRSHPERTPPQLLEDVGGRSEGSRGSSARSFGRSLPSSEAKGPQNDVNVCFVRVVTHFLGRPLRHLWGTNPRLLRRGMVRWNNREVHEQVVRQDGSLVRLGDPDTALLRHPLDHHSHYTTLRAYLEKREKYTTRDAEEMLATGRDRLGKPVENPLRSPLSTLRFLYERAIRQFVRLFVKKRGFLDGWQGWLWCFLSAQYEYLMCRKYLGLLRMQQNVE